MAASRGSLSGRVGPLVPLHGPVIAQGMDDAERTTCRASAGRGWLSTLGFGHLGVKVAAMAESRCIILSVRGVAASPIGEAIGISSEGTRDPASRFDCYGTLKLRLAPGIFYVLALGGRM